MDETKAPGRIWATPGDAGTWYAACASSEPFMDGLDTEYVRGDIHATTFTEHRDEIRNLLRDLGMQQLYTDQQQVRAEKAEAERDALAAQVKALETAEAERAILIEDLEEVYQVLTPGAIDNANLDGMAFAVERAIKHLRALTGEAS